jgi:uncharacterized protein (DUF58 family)
VLNSFKQRFRNWLFRPKIEHGTIILTQRRIFILPTRQGLAFCLLLLLMLLGDINYNLSLGYVLTFLLAMMALLSMLYAYRNLAHLEIRAGRSDAVFCGETAYFLLHFNNPSRLPRYQLTVSGDRSVSFNAPALTTCDISFPLPTTRRGYLQTGRLKLYTEFPLGLFYAWSYLHFDTRCLIYPKPLSDAPVPSGADGTGKRVVSGDDDIAGLRNYAPGDALPRIAWKAYARGHALQVKQFSTQAGEEIWLNLDDAPDDDIENKLSRMTRWVLDAQNCGTRYGLRLPDSELTPDNGANHRDECLRRLALFNLPEESPPLPNPSPTSGRGVYFAPLSRKRERKPESGT